MNYSHTNRLRFEKWSHRTLLLEWNFRKISKYTIFCFTSVCFFKASYFPLKISLNQMSICEQGSQLNRWFIVVQSLSHIRLFATSWTAECQAALSFTLSQSMLKVMSIYLVMSSNYLILFCPLFLPHSIFPNIRVFSNRSALRISWPEYWSFSFGISPSNE